MKKVIALLLGLMMLCQFALVSAEEMSNYRELNGKYQISYPSTWVMIDKESIVSIVEKISSGDVVIEGMNAEAVKQSEQAMSSSPLVLFMAPTGMDNMNITYVENPGFAGFTVREFIQQAGELMVQQFQSVYSDYETVDPGSIVTIGEKTFGRISNTATMNGGKSQQSQFYFLDGPTMYYLTFTFRLVDGKLPEGAEELMHQIAESFIPA